MLNNSPVIRGVIYALAVISAILAIILKPISQEWSDAVSDVAVYLGGLAGLTAGSNLTTGGDVKLLDAIRPSRSTTLDD